jgi:xylulokinase
MPKTAVLVIDLGTTVLKTSLFDFRCRLLDRVECPHSTSGNDLGSAARRWWAIIVNSACQLTQRNPGVEVAVIGLTGYMHAAVALDGAGEPIAFQPDPALARACFDALIDRFGARELYTITGSRMDVTSVPPQLAAWRSANARAYAALRTILPVKDFLRFRLTGEIATDPIDACGSMFYDVNRAQWDPALLAWCGLETSNLPPVLACTALAGRLTRAAAAELNLAAGTPVAVGGGDDIEIIGSGARSPNELCEHVGTTGSFLVASRGARSDPSMRLEVYPGIADGEWITGASCNNVARALDWFLASSSYCSNGCLDWSRVQADLDRALPRMGSASPLFLPYLTGERAPLWDPDLSACWFGLRSSHSQADLLASVVEGICFSLRNLFDSFAPLGLEIQRVFSSGGLNQLDTLALRASIYSRPIRIVRGSDPTSYASAALALTSIGELADPWEASAWLECAPAVEPDPQWQSLLDERYSRFVAHTQALQSANEECAPGLV